MAEVIVIDGEAATYADAIAERLPGVRVHAVTAAAGAHAFAASADVLVALAHSIPDDLVAAMPKLRWVQSLTTGVDHLMGLQNLVPSVVVTSARGVHGPQMSEMAFLHMLALSRNLRATFANQAAARWERWPQRLLLGKTAVLVGVGAISEDLASRCQAFGMRVVGISDSRPSAPGFDAILPRARLTEAAGQADFLIVLVPLEASTRGLVDAAVLAAMRPDAFLINLARGPVVDEAALADALRAGAIAGAGLDVFEVEPLPAASPLWGMPNVIVTPHVGGMSDTYAQQVMPLLLTNLATYAAGRIEDLRNVVRR